MPVQAGDVVMYRPAECHALDWTPSGFAWSFRTPPDRRGDSEELDDEEVKKLLKRCGPSRKAPIVPHEPKVSWRAVVRAVHPDGTTLDLDVDGPNGGQTIHVNGVKQSTEQPPMGNTWHFT